MLAHGDICFDIVFDNLSLAQLDFVRQPIPYTFRLPGLTETANGFLTSCILRPLGAELTLSGCDEAVGFGILQVVMKDGSQAQLHANIFGNGSYSYTSVVPMDLEEVDYLLLENGTQLHPIDP